MVKKLEPPALGDLFRRRYDTLAAEAPKPTLEQAVKGIVSRVEHVYRVQLRALSLGDLTHDLSPHIEATLNELGRLGVLRWLPRAEAYLPGYVSDATWELFNSEMPGTGRVPEEGDDEYDDEDYDEPENPFR